MSADSTPKRKILVVDDDPALLDAIERSFVTAGETVVASGTFQEARRNLMTQSFDVLLTDVRLGAYNGLQLAVLARDLAPDIQVIVFSGFDDPVLRADATRMGATYLVKPVTASRILEVIRSG